MNEYLLNIDLFTVLEIIATISGVICVYLQTQEKVIAWPFGILNVALLSIIFFDSNLLSDFILNTIFLVLNVYGWWYWSTRSESETELSIIPIKLTNWLPSLLVILLMTPIWGYFMKTRFNADLAFADAFTTVGSLVAQYLLAKKYLLNWMIWIIVDVIAIGVYLYKDLYFVALLFAIYLLICIKGYRDWKLKIS